MAKFFERNSTKLTVSEFYDNYMSKKYNFDASYQRKGDVWLEDKKSFLIDSILKNYPIPAIFMRPIVDEDGKTQYDIIDGKQRLQAIVSFIENKIPLTTYFSEDDFFDELEQTLAEKISGRCFEDIKKEKFADIYIKQFWTYTLQIEYLYEEKLEFVSAVFDRLNRNGEPLNRQELRNAKYGTSYLSKVVRDLTNIDYFKDKFKRIKKERMEDEEFISELLFLIIEGEILDSSPKILDEKYEKYQSKNDILDKSKQHFIDVIEYINNLNLDYEKNKRLCWTTHLYTLFSVGFYCIKHNIPVNTIEYNIKEFYEQYFSNSTRYTGFLKEYKDASSSRTRSATQRKKRMDSILKYCKVYSYDM